MHLVRTKEGKVLAVDTGLWCSELAISRSRIYKTLSAAYVRPPDKELVQFLGSWGSLLRQLPGPGLPGMMKGGLRKVRDWVKRSGSPSSEETLTYLGVEFTRLFRGLNPFHSPPPPYESVYLDGGLLYGAATERVTEKYRRFRLKAQNGEAPDHIALELDFMRVLCEREGGAWETGDGAQGFLKEEEAFLNEHLARWVPIFCETIRRFDTTSFYEGLADLTEGWIYCDQKAIRGLLEL